MNKNALGRILQKIGSMLSGSSRRRTHTTSTRRSGGGLRGLLRRIFG
ncbi:hypothetical protein [Euzebya tangerina]|nr:hypothetical protein [Euzebya tangerina]